MSIRLLLVPMSVILLAAQPAWKEFSIGPATPKRGPNANNVAQGVLRSDSITLRTLIGIATGVPWVRVLGPGWLDSEHYAVAATLSDESHLRLRTRSPEEPRIADEFRSLLTAELVRHFHLEFHREKRDIAEYTLQAVEGGSAKFRPAASVRERGRLNINHSALSRGGTLDARSVTFRTIASWLQNSLKGPVTAADSLPPGAFDFHLTWKASDEASLFNALKDQLGLELVKQPGSPEYVVVDRAERPGPPPATDGSTASISAGRDSSLRYAPAQLQRDLRIAREALQEGHPGIYRYTSKAAIDRAFTQAAGQLRRPMTALEFYRVLAPVVAALKCGHTSLRPSSAIQQRLSTEPLLPIEAAVLGGKVYVARDFSGAVEVTGAELRTINGTPIDRILAHMLAVTHGDGDSATAGPYQLSHRRSFARNLYLLAGLQSPFRVEYTLGGKTAEATLTGMPLKDMRDSAPAASSHLTQSGATAIMKIAEFDGSAEGGEPLSAFFERSFNSLRDQNVANLILDVRDNGGGEDELGRRLFSYFTDQPFRYYRDLILNKLSFRFGGQALPPNVNQLAKRAADGKYHVTGHPNWGMQQPGAPHFGGKVFVLMNGGSFSTTCEFLAMLHHHGGATFLGEETAGGYYGNTSGAAASVTLPNSKLILPVQLVGYYLAIDGTVEGAHGIRPDHEVVYSIEDVLAGRDKAMEMTLRLTGR